MMKEKREVTDALQMNLLVRRKAKENNFKSVLETVKDLLVSFSNSNSVVGQANANTSLSQV